jgi:hypothetical protein
VWQGDVRVIDYIIGFIVVCVMLSVTIELWLPAAAILFAMLVELIRVLRGKY